MTFYGLGTILGAGIYVLLGPVSARAGYYLPLSFLIAALTSLVTLLVFAVVNACLWKLKRAAIQPQGIVSYPVAVPEVGIVLCLALIAAHLI